MADEPGITLDETETEGRYEARVADSDAVGIMSYRRRNADTLVVEHTLVPDALRGRGIASALVKRLIADAREKDLKIVPQCSFVRAQFERHPDWADLRAD